MAIIRFEQDPYAPAGAGKFFNEQGDATYAYHPEAAAQLSMPAPDQLAPRPMQPSQEMMNAAAPQQDQRLAVAGFPSTGQRLAHGGTATGLDTQLSRMPEPPPVARDVIAGMSQPAPPGLAVGRSPTDPIAPSSGQAPENLGQAVQQLQGERVGQAMLREKMAPTRTTPAHFSPSTKQATVSDQGPQESEEGKALREDAFYGGLAATQNAGDAEQERLGRAAELNRQQAEDTRAQIDLQQKTSDDVRQLVGQDKADLDKFKTELVENQKSFDPNRLFHGKNTAAGIGAVIFRAIGAYAAVKGHTANMAGDVIDGFIERDIAQQKQAIESGKGNVNNALASLQNHYGDLNQATNALRQLQHTYADAQMQALSNASGIPQVQSKTQQAIADKQTQYAKDNFEFEKIAAGKHTVAVSEKYIPAQTTGGGAVSVDKELERAGKLASIRATNASATETENKARGAGRELAIPDGRGGTVMARDKTDAHEIRKLYPMLETVNKTADAMSQIAKDTSVVSGHRIAPWNSDAERKWNVNLETLMNTANTLYGQGVVREDDVKRWRSGLAGEPWSAGAQAALAEIKQKANDHYDGIIKAQGAGPAKPTGKPIVEIE